MNLHFHDEDWDRIRRDYAAWWEGELERPLVQVSEWAPVPGRTYEELPRRTAAYPLEMPPEEVIDLVTARMEATRFHGDAYPRWWPDFGPGMLAGFLGARVTVVPETVWFDPPEPLQARDIRPRLDPQNPWWQRVVALTQAAGEAWEGRVQVGHTDLGGNLDVIASLRATEGLLLDLLDAPDQVARLVDEVTAAWLECYDKLYALIRPASPGTVPWAPIWSPGKGYMLQSDFAYMISPGMFEQFVVPDLEACCGYLDHGFYHLDGPAQIPHLPLLLAIERLRGIQWIPGAGNAPADGWLELLGRIRAGGKLCQVFVSAEGAHTIVKHLGGRGFMLTVDEQMPADEAKAFINVLSRDDRAYA